MKFHSRHQPSGRWLHLSEPKDLEWCHLAKQTRPDVGASSLCIREDPAKQTMLVQHVAKCCRENTSSFPKQDCDFVEPLTPKFFNAAVRRDGHHDTHDIPRVRHDARPRLPGPVHASQMPPGPLAILLPEGSEGMDSSDPDLGMTSPWWLVGGSSQKFDDLWFVKYWYIFNYI